MPHKILTSKHFVDMPWRNGGGSTRELYSWPKDEAFKFRVSIAQIKSSGPFSTFDGYDRFIIPLNGSPLLLTHDQDVVGVQHFQVHNFDGGVPTHGQLLGDEPATDFNLMVAMDFARADCRCEQGNIGLRKADWQMFYVLDGSYREASLPVRISAGELFLADALDAELKFEGRGRAVAISITKL